MTAEQFLVTGVGGQLDSTLPQQLPEDAGRLPPYEKSDLCADAHVRAAMDWLPISRDPPLLVRVAQSADHQARRRRTHGLDRHASVGDQTSTS